MNLFRFVVLNKIKFIILFIFYIWFCTKLYKVFNTELSLEFFILTCTAGGFLGLLAIKYASKSMDRFFNKIFRVKTPLK